MTKKEENNGEPKIFVIYLGVSNVDEDDLAIYCQKVSEKIIPKTVEGEFIVIPIRDTTNTRIECINPKYITDKDLIAEHTKLLLKLQADLLKEEAAMNKPKITPKINVQIKEESPVEKLKSALKKPIEMKFEESNKKSTKVDPSKVIKKPPVMIKESSNKPKKKK